VGGSCTTQCECGDSFGQTDNLNTTWTQHTVYFGTLEQEGWGRVFADADLAHLMTIELQVNGEAQFDYIVDDFVFY
jgi:hypothetical protein